MLSFADFLEIQNNTQNNTQNESKQIGKLYHFTPLFGFNKLLKSNLIFKSPNGYISSTRMWNFTSYDNDFGPNYYNIRITLDGSKLSHRFKIKPINGLDSNDSNIFGTDKNNERVPHKTEFEEVILTKNPLDLHPYILEIQALDTDKINEWYKNLSEEEKNILNKLNFKIVKKFTK